MTLTGDQMRAVQRLGQNVCVIGGPGSGKTRLLAERFRWRVLQGLTPSRLLVLTFTEQAAAELRREVALGEPERTELREEIGRAQISTIATFCARLLRRHAIEAGLDPAFGILKAADTQTLLRTSAEDALDGVLRERPQALRELLEAADLSDPAASLVDAYAGMRLAVLGGPQNEPARKLPDFCEILRDLVDCARRILKAKPLESSNRRDWAEGILELADAPPGLQYFEFFNGWKNTLKAPEQEQVMAARQALAAEYFAPQRALLWESIIRLAETYQVRKRACRALDSFDLVELTISLLRDHAELRRSVRDSFDEVLLDELQDTNPLEETLIDLICRPGRFFAVGDLNQSICGFRYADPGVLERYCERVQLQGHKVDMLHQNHRARPEILAAVEAILLGRPGIRPHRLEPARWFADKNEPSVEVIAALSQTGGTGPEEEALWVARRIRELVGELRIAGEGSPETRPAQFSDFAVILPGFGPLPLFERAFQNFGVPFAVCGRRNLFEAREIRDLVHWLRAVANGRDEIGMAAVLRSPLAGIRDETLLRLKQAGSLEDGLIALEKADVSLFEAGELDRLTLFRRQWMAARAEVDDVSPNRLLWRAIDASGYEDTLHASARANVRRFLGILREWHASNPRPLPELVRYLEERRAIGAEEDPAPATESSAVRILSIDGAKGLEFPIVFLACLHQSPERSAPPLAFSPASGLVARWCDPATGEAISDPPYAAYCEELARKQSEEDDRLLYVAMTRAAEHLVLSFATPAPRHWAGTVISGLGLSLKGTGAGAVVHQCTQGRRSFAVRVLTANGRPEELPPPAAFTGDEPERRLSPAPRAESYDAVAPASAVWLFGVCPRRYYLAGYIGWDGRAGGIRSGPRIASSPHLEDTELEPSEFGRQVHAMLGGADVRNVDRSAIELVSRFETSELGRRAACAERREEQYDFVAELEGVVLEGRIDLWFVERGELVLVDYKTDEVEAAEAVRHAGAYALQLQLYALALERTLDRLPDWAGLYLLHPNVTVPVPLGTQDIHDARETVRSFRQAQAELKFPGRAGPHCRRCPYYRGLCPG